MYNVLIVEDDPMARKLMEIFVSSSEGYQLVPSVAGSQIDYPEFYGKVNEYVRAQI